MNKFSEVWYSGEAALAVLAATTVISLVLAFL